MEAAIGSLALTVVFQLGCQRKPDAPASRAASRKVATPTPRPTPLAFEAVAPQRWEAAIARVEEPRSSRGRISVPQELRLYDDTRRFLAVQMADARDEGYVLPDDLAELAGMVLRNELVELSAMTDSYMLYETATDVQEDPLSHYDVGTGQDVPLLASPEAWESERERLSAVAGLERREGRRARHELEVLTSWYDDPARSQRLFHEHADVTALARDWGGACYDLTQPGDRARFQVRLMSCVRRPVRAILEAVSRSYQEWFGRPLPVSSLIRTQRYQRRLQRINQNATRVDFPPHATGMAFDVSYKYMPPDEQNFLMQHVARLEDAGRVEALRERRNSIHVYTFAHGPPPEGIVQAYLERVDEARRRVRGFASRAAPAKRHARRHPAARARGG